MSRARVPPLAFDGRLFWYTTWFDPTDDLCCAHDCRKAIPEGDVPLILFQDRPPDARGQKVVWQSRVHFDCAERLGLFRNGARL